MRNAHFDSVASEPMIHSFFQPQSRDSSQPPFKGATYLHTDLSDLAWAYGRASEALILLPEQSGLSQQENNHSGQSSKVISSLFDSIAAQADENMDSFSAPLLGRWAMGHQQ